MRSNYILDVKVNSNITKRGAVKHILKLISSKDKKNHIVCTTNPEFIMDAQKDAKFKKIINGSALSVPDGIGVLLAEEYLLRMRLAPSKRNKVLFALATGLQIGLEAFTKPNKYRSTSGVDLVTDLCTQSKKNISVFFLGGWPKNFLGRNKDVEYDLATKAANVLKKINPKLRVVGATSQFSHKPLDDEKTIKFIKSCMKENNVSSIDVIFVAYNHRNQEKWLSRNIHKIPASIGIGVGATFDYIAGEHIRAPKLFRHFHLEWLFRLLVQPYRIKRILTAFPKFPLTVFLKSL